jgi:hypothetical protein
MKNLKLKMVIILTTCFLNIIKADCLLFPEMISAKLGDYASLTNFLSLNYLDYKYSLNPDPKEEWKLCSETDKIFIYERMVKINNDHYTRERKGELRVNCNFDKVVKIMSSYESLNNWMNGVKENSLVKRSGSTSWITYNVFSLPWPFDNRDMVSEYQLNSLKAGIYIQININCVNNLVKPKKGLSRIESYKATWHIKRVNEHSVWISFSALSDTPPVVPRFIQDPIVENTFIKNLVSLRTYMESGDLAKN